MAYGLTPVKTGSAGGGDARTNVYSDYVVAQAYGTDLFKGDPLKMTATGYIERAAATDVIIGVFAGCYYETTGGVIRNIYGNFIAADAKAGDARVEIWDNPDQVFEIEADQVGTALDQGNVGNNTDVTAGTGSAITNLSGFFLDSSGTVSASTAQMRILGAGQQVSLTPSFSSVGTAMAIRVKINEHFYNQAAGV